ncbi:MAG: hypothetical protein HY547_09195 [Elusimicrobia bacterium]|nr:hypothetical protein [Elusimicrobiota bacterium]
MKKQTHPLPLLDDEMTPEERSDRVIELLSLAVVRMAAEEKALAQTETAGKETP